MHHAYRSAPDSGIDSSMLSKLNSRRSVDNRSPSRWPNLSASAVDTRPTRPTPMELPKLLSLPVRSRHLPQPILDSPHRFTQTPVVSEASPHSNPFGRHSADYRSPVGTEPGDLERSPDPRSTRTNSGSLPDDFAIPTQGSYDTRDDDVDFPMEETSRLRMLKIEDTIRERERELRDRGQKRRASSPPSDDPPLPSDLFRRRDGAACVSRGSPTPRLTPMPQSSVSSVSSAGRSASSFMGLTTASSMTSIASYGQRSPPGRSPVSPTDIPSYESPFATHGSFAALSRSSSMGLAAAIQQQQHQRTLSDLPPVAQGNRAMVSPRKLTEPLKSNNSIATKMHAFHMCECCPKKPKKFETREELMYVKSMF